MSLNQKKTPTEYCLEYSKNNPKNCPENMGNNITKSEPARLHHYTISHRHGDVLWLFCFYPDVIPVMSPELACERCWKRLRRDCVRSLQSHCTPCIHVPA